MYRYFKNVNGSSPDSVSEIETENEIDEVSKLIKKKRSLISNDGMNRNIDDAIGEFYSIYTLNEKENILEYWINNKTRRPELYFLSKIIFAVPASQASVERAFSSPKFIYSDLRVKLNEDILESILCVRLNKELSFDLVFYQSE